MCGIAGIFSNDKDQIRLEKIKGITDSISHRGPDGDGHWINEEGTLALGHRRLSIIDLSDSGKQPMHYLDRYTITFNGEIYNYLEIREDLIKEGYKFKSSSDTEVLLALFDSKKEQCLEYIDGMFAFAIWDNQHKTLFCARDRFGEKPFHYNYIPGKQFVFASEIKGLWNFGIKKVSNDRMLFNYLAYNYVTNPENGQETFFEDILKLEPAHYMLLDKHCNIITYKRYWDIDYKSQDNSISLDKAVSEFRDLFTTSITNRLRSDVPVGSSLSGGLDSSATVLMINSLKQNDNMSQHTFSARFNNSTKDEGYFMNKVIEMGNINPHFVFPEGEGFAQELDDLCYFQDEPFISASIYAQYKVMELAKQNNITVLLDGQGADEILGGYTGFYDTYFFELKKKNKAVYQEQFALYKELHKDNTINSSKRRALRSKVRSMLTNSQILSGLKYKLFMDQFLGKSIIFKDFLYSHQNDSFNKQYKFQSLNEALYYHTMKGDLQDLLRFCDRNSMAHSREVRLPFLSHKLVEFLFTLPSHYKINAGWTKFLLRESMKDILPSEITWRKDKIGYEPPQKKWLQSIKNAETKHQSLERVINVNSNQVDFKALILSKYLPAL
jgi:asparagine synthase (glutamine-hydrolysing)